MLPLSATDPMPLLIVADAALAEIHVNFALAPTAIVAGEAANETVGIAPLATKPLHPVNIPVVNPKARDKSNKREFGRRRLFMAALGC